VYLYVYISSVFVRPALHTLQRLVIWCVTLYWYREIVRDQGDADVHDESHVLVFICVTVVGEEREER
jgi:hypothetical protein